METRSSTNGANVKNQIKERWDKLSDSDINTAATNLDRLSPFLQKTYSLSQEDADRDVEEFRAFIKGENTPMKPNERQNRPHA